jgi:hypothetical protein
MFESIKNTIKTAFKSPEDMAKEAFSQENKEKSLEKARLEKMNVSNKEKESQSVKWNNLN